MNVRLAIAAIAGLASLPAFAAEEVYVIDPVHSNPQWETRHIGMSSQRGNFGKATGKIMLDRAAKKGSVDVTIDATSIRTFDGRLDQIVKGDRFFNVEKFPTITFKSTGMTFEGENIASVDGDLTLLGVTKPVTLKVTHFNCGQDPFRKRSMCAADAVATIKRSDFGMTNGLNINNPADEVKLMIPVEGYLEQPQG
jgi:polyisoprenoid-binding protein YceI